MKYTKRPLTFEQQAELLLSRCLIADRAEMAQTSPFSPRGRDGGTVQSYTRHLNCSNPQAVRMIRTETDMGMAAMGVGVQ